MRTRIVCIVEGHGEVAAVPILVRRIGEAVAPHVTLTIPRPLRLARAKFVSESEFGRFLHLASLEAGDHGAILALADCDDDCGPELASTIGRFAAVQASAVPVGIVFARRMYEAWFVAAASSLAGTRGLKAGLVPPDEPELLNSPKRWLESNHERNAVGSKRWVYSETADQPALSSQIDINLARGAPSFDKLYREVRRLIGADAVPLEN